MRDTIIRTWSIAALGLTIACTPAEESATQDTMRDTGPAGATGDRSTTVQLSAVGESGVSGRVIVTPSDTGTALAIHIMGAEGSYLGHVHRGSCADAGESAPVADLGTVTLTAGGMVDVSPTVALPYDTLVDGQHFIGFHRGSGGPHVVCADIR